ncbi:thymidylate synthase, partial [Salmonella enterica]
MKQYQDLIQDVLTNGSWQDNRTGIRTLSIPGAMMRFDLQKGFPAVTTK